MPHTQKLMNMAKFFKTLNWSLFTKSMLDSSLVLFSLQMMTNIFTIRILPNTQCYQLLMIISVKPLPFILHWCLIKLKACMQIEATLMFVGIHRDCSASHSTRGWLPFYTSNLVSTNIELHLNVDSYKKRLEKICIFCSHGKKTR